MPSNVCVPFFKPGQDVTGRVTTTAVTGKRFVAPVAGGRGGQPYISPAAAGVMPMGVAGHDQEVGSYVHVNIGGTVPVVCGADIAAGARVAVGAGGTAVPYTDAMTQAPVGLCWSGAVAGAAAPIQLNLG